MTKRTHTQTERQLREVLGKEVNRTIGTYRRLRMSCAYLSSCSAQLPICRPSGSVEDCHRKSGGPTGQAGQLPSANESFSNPASISGKILAPTKWELEYPVRIELVSGIEIRDPA